MKHRTAELPMTHADTGATDGAADASAIAVLSSPTPTWWRSESMLAFFRSKPALAFAAVVAGLFLARGLLLPLADDLAGRPGELPAMGAQFIRTLMNVAAIVTAALPFQLLLPAVQRRPKVLTREYWLDVLYWHQGLLLQLVSISAGAMLIERWLWSWTAGPWLPSAASWPVWLQVLLAVWLYDFIVYWRHRSEHVLGALWSFHSVHHSTEQVDVLTTLRLHPLELVYATVTNSFVLMIGFDLQAVAMGYAIYTYWNYFIHTNVRIRFSGLMKHVLITPFMHQWHHAFDARASGKNLGVVFAWNDWLFGSAYHPDHWPTRFGMDVPLAQRLPQRYWRQLVYPLQYAWTIWRKA